MILRRLRDKSEKIRFDALPDKWTFIEDDAPLPSEGAILVTAARWLAERDTLIRHKGGIGALLAPDGDTEALGAAHRGLDLIALQFPVFKDGRAYSQARLLRERYGFAGELRACGDVLRDQLAFMERCGFDAFAPAKPLTLAEAGEALAEFSLWYQPTADGRIPAWQLRGSIPPAPRLATGAGGA